MSYHDLSECTLSPAERELEKDELVTMILDGAIYGELGDVELKFVQSMVNAHYVSVKQLFWLRDIKDKYL